MSRPAPLPQLPVPTRVVSDPRRAALALADELEALLSRRPEAVLGLATGHTPLLLYRELAERVRTGRVSLARATSFNLDEYVGLAADHPGSFRAFMARALFGEVDLPPERRHFLCGEARDARAECARYEASLSAAGGVDWQVLGIGRNAHIAFNEPGSPSDSRTRRVELCEETRAANRPDFPPDEEVPGEALTMGLGTILEARRLRVMAFGASKAAAVRAALLGPRRDEVPASHLRAHPDVELWLDVDAAMALSPNA